MFRLSSFRTRILWLLAASMPALAAAYQTPETTGDGWAVADASKTGWDVGKLDAIGTKVADGTWKGITSVVVARDGALVYEHYFNDGARDRLNDMRSATKSITSLLVGAAIDRGLISDVSVKVYPYFPDKQPVANPDPRKADFTLEDLLTMSSLWECNDDNEFSRGNEERMYVIEDWIRFALDLPIRGFAPWDTRPADSPYHRAFSYCTAGSFVAGAIVERAAHEHLDTFAAKVLEKPLGITDVHWNFAPDGTAMGGGGTRYRSRDIARIGRMIADGGEWRGKRIIAKSWIDAALAPHAKARDDAEYGYLFWRFHFPHKGKDQPVWAMSGNGGNYVFIAPDLKLVAVITSTAYNQRYAHPQSQAIFRDFILAAMP